MLKSAGFNPGVIDGDWGPNTDTAMDAFEARFAQIAAAAGTFHSRTETSIKTLHPKAQVLARRSLNAIRNAGINARIISGTRTYAEQNRLFAQGRFGNPGPIITNARGGQSNHNFGIAWDVGIFSASGAYLGNSPKYAQAGVDCNGRKYHGSRMGRQLDFVHRSNALSASHRDVDLADPSEI